MVDYTTDLKVGEGGKENTKRRMRKEETFKSKRE